MSTLELPADSRGFAHAARVLTFASFLGAAVVTTLVAGEMVTVAAALVYSLVVLFHLSNGVGVALAVLIGAPALWGIVAVAKLAWEAETDPANN